MQFIKLLMFHNTRQSLFSFALVKYHLKGNEMAMKFYNPKMVVKRKEEAIYK